MLLQSIRIWVKFVEQFYPIQRALVLRSSIASDITWC